MTLLGKNKYIEDEQIKKPYTLPAMVYRNGENKEISLNKSLFLSALLHPTLVFVSWLLVFVLALLGIKFLVFEKPEPKMRDIEFVLVNKEAEPINKRTPYRADMNSRAGGEHDPTKKVSMPSPAPSKAQAPKSAQPQKPAQQPKIQEKQPPKQTQPQKPVQQPQPQKPQEKPVETKTPSPAPPRPTLTPSAPKITDKPKSEFAIPVPKATLPQAARPSGGGGPVTSAPSGSSGSKASAPAPSFAPSAGSSGSLGNSGRFSGNSAGSGNIGNPGPGNPKGAPGIDALKEPDFGPYMKELQRRIKMNWEPPKGNESKRVVLLFSIARDGRLLNVQVAKSSGVPTVDNAAISAVKLSAPFRPLPPEHKGSSVDINFTFDYNVLGATGYH